MVSVALLLICPGLALGTAQAGTVVQVPEKSVVDSLDFENSDFGEWEHSSVKLVNSSNQEGEGSKPVIPSGDPPQGNVAVYVSPLSGSKWGTLSRNLTVRAYTKVNIEFMIFVSGYISTNPTNKSLTTINNPDFQLLWGLHGVPGDILTNLYKLNVGSKWTRYIVSVTTDNATHDYDLRFQISSGHGDGVVALDSLQVEVMPLVGKQYVRVEEEEETTAAPTVTNTDTQINTTTNNTNITNNSNDTITDTNTGTNVTNNTNTDTNTGTNVTNNTNTDTNTSTNVTNNTNTDINTSTNVTNNTNTDTNTSTNVTNNTNTDTNTSTNVTNNTNTDTNTGTNVTNNTNTDTNTDTKITHSTTAIVTTTIGNISTENKTKIDPTKSSSSKSSSEASPKYGYTGEVILICLTVLFAILFLIMVVKYKRLKSHFGDYQLDPTPGQARPVSRPPEYDNPAYNVQMTYRDGD